MSLIRKFKAKAVEFALIGHSVKCACVCVGGEGSPEPYLEVLEKPCDVKLRTQSTQSLQHWLATISLALIYIDKVYYNP